ncbi:Fe2+/Zn2+ uptake regulation protein [Halobacteroides halobius DSM 5150]|uniref:Fe2+/Zn2+ uptake regulation protein n=1 Tax=Halobacteroides halobius (strain ATCC 35273 / DSM 5150 / MD-1) TaxID=748449 RepID=L0K7Z8_HALHC|nr:Fur family transcriptional regulator [Halobacteroides halobius]AGB40479.1 Fe2+/Zn2+ uptake regulation protein [Halobacteroides halobius DSM 5150]
MKINLKNLKTILAANNYQLTFQRKLILQLFLNTKEKHLSAEDIYNSIKDEHPSIGLSTIYRTLDTFLNSGIIKELDFDTKCRCYELKDEGVSHHYHLICIKCNKIVETNGKMIDRMKLCVKNKYNFKVLDHKIKIHGYCEECS